MKKALFVVTFVVVSLGLGAQTLVYTPALKSPANNATDQMPDVILSWYAVAGSLNLQYQLQLDTTLNFNSPLLVDVTQTLITGYQTNRLLFNTTYYWRVRAIDGATSPWSEVWNFKIFSKVGLFKPSNNATKQESNVQLQWRNMISGTTVTGVEFFKFQADTSQNFNSPALVAGQVAGTAFTANTQWLLFGATYYWRVQAGHALSLSEWSDPFNFTVLESVTLSSPNNNSVNQVLDVTLKWKVVGGILAYQYEISANENFTSLIVQGETDQLQVNAEFLMFGGDYWWRIRARHQRDTTLWGGPYKFTTINTVLLKSPSNNQVNVPVTPTMMWTGQTGITGFQLQIATDLGFTDLFYDIKPLATETDAKVTKKMAYNTVYYWRMRAFSDGTSLADTTDWSEPWKFTTAEPQGISNLQAIPFSIYPNPATGKAFLKVTVKEPTEARITVIDLLGKTILEQVVTLNTGENVQPILLEDVRKGIYIVRLTLNGETVNQKLIVE